MSVHRTQTLASLLRIYKCIIIVFSLKISTPTFNGRLFCIYTLQMFFFQPSDLKALAAAHNANKTGASQQYHQPKYSEAEYNAHQYQDEHSSSQYKQENFSGYDSDYDNVPSCSVINGKSFRLVCYYRPRT